MRLSSVGVRVRRVLPRSALAWLFSVFLVHGAILRVLSASRVLAKWANNHERATWAVALGLCVGVLEDACVCVAVTISLWLLGTLGVTGQRLFTANRHRLEVEGTTTTSSSLLSPSSSSSSSLVPTATLVAIHFLLANAAFYIDLVFVRTRHMRFTWDFVALAWRNRRDAFAQLEVDDTEWLVALEMGSVTLFCTVLMWLRLDDRAAWRAYPLAEWDHELWRATVRRARSNCSHALDEPASPTESRASPVRLAKELQDGDVEAANDAAQLLEPGQRSSGSYFSPSQERCGGLVVRLLRLVILWCVLTATTLVITKTAPSLVAMLAWNASLCEPLRLATGVECMTTRSIHLPQKLRSLLDTTTEQCTFVQDDADTLVRKTLGFTGPLAFDVAVQRHEKPNVLVVVIESFRQRDSRYLLASRHLDQFLPHNISLTPHFDAWTKRGVGFRSMWSSWRTSRSLEQILFGQLPLDSATDSGITTGRTSVRLSGIPQLLKAKGYETLFTTGSRLDYDEWDTFLPSHGFDMCMNGWDLAEIGQHELGIDWTRGDHMMAYWGMHDDLTFEVLGHELKKKHAAKANGAAPPWFAMHYTISSHVPFDERPDWFYRYRESDQMPNFSALYESFEDLEIRELVQNYAEMRYFTDLTLGSFLGDLERSGVLNDTIVVITGDHGHSPENGAAMPEEDQVGAMNVAAALIAEGRLGKYAGTIIDDVTAHYDWLNTIADIVGLPQDGFLQTGIGRSLKRKPLDADRVVYSHNPALNLAAVQGHTRMEFYADVPDVVRVFNIEQDPRREKDLRSDIPKSRLHEIERICDEARALNGYFTERWQADCLLPPHDCQQP